MAAQSGKRFVVQEHARGSERHWDLMLEADGVLWTWRVAVAPEEIGDVQLEVVKIFDHPIRFLSYEGAVNNGQGSVRIADKGAWDVMSEDEECLSVLLEGEKLKGIFELRRIEGDSWTIRRCVEG
jgi:DNA ligase D-like protein (predicted 3'-phosphoesterase)